MGIDFAEASHTSLAGDYLFQAIAGMVMRRVAAFVATLLASDISPPRNRDAVFTSGPRAAKPFTLVLAQDAYSMRIGRRAPFAQTSIELSLTYVSTWRNCG